MKRVFAIVLTISLLLGLCACGDNKKQEVEENESALYDKLCEAFKEGSAVLYNANGGSTFNVKGSLTDNGKTFTISFNEEGITVRYENGDEVNIKEAYIAKKDEEYEAYIREKASEGLRMQMVSLDGSIYAGVYDEEALKSEAEKEASNENSIENENPFARSFEEYLGQNLSSIEKVFGSSYTQLWMDGPSCYGLQYELTNCLLQFQPDYAGTQEEAKVDAIWFTDKQGIQSYYVTESCKANMSYARAMAALEQDGYTVTEAANNNGMGGINMSLEARRPGIFILLEWSANSYNRTIEDAATSITVQTYGL